MNQVKDVVNSNLVANVTKFLYRSLYLILAAALASAALVCAAPAHAQEGPPPAPAPGPENAPQPAPAPAPAPENAKPVTPQPDGSHLVPEGVKESTPAPVEGGSSDDNAAPGPEGSSLPEPAPQPAMVDTSINPNPPFAPGSMQSLEMEHEGKTRRYLLRIPNHYSPEKAAPVLFGFGGWGDSPENYSSYARMQTTEANNEAIIVYPEGFERAWEAAPYAKTRDGEDIRFIKRILDSVDKDYHVDRNRVYAMGMSNGGGFTSVLGCHAQDTFAAVAMVSGAFYNPVEVNCADAPMNTLIMHGVNDKMMTYEGGDRHEAGYLPVRTVLGGYLKRNRCDMTFQATPEAGGSERLSFNGCQKDVQLVKVPQDHTWFWQPDTPRVVWDFLSSKTRV